MATSPYANILRTLALIAVSGLIALPGPAQSTSPSLKLPFEDIIPIDKIQDSVAQLSKQLDPGAGMTWSPVLTPPLPNTWPPTKAGKIVWLRYGYARGHKFPPENLADAERISRPWLRIELHPDIKQARLVLLSNKLDPVSIQGVRPLQANESFLFTKAKEYEALALGIQYPLNPDDPKILELKKFYQLWLQTNGAIAEQLKPMHGNFFEWASKSNL